MTENENNIAVNLSRKGLNLNKFLNNGNNNQKILYKTQLDSGLLTQKNKNSFLSNFFSKLQNAYSSSNENIILNNQENINKTFSAKSLSKINPLKINMNLNEINSNLTSSSNFKGENNTGKISISSKRIFIFLFF